MKKLALFEGRHVMLCFFTMTLIGLFGFTNETSDILTGSNLETESDIAYSVNSESLGHSSTLDSIPDFPFEVIRIEDESSTKTPVVYPEKNPGNPNDPPRQLKIFDDIPSFPSFLYSGDLLTDYINYFIQKEVWISNNPAKYNSLIIESSENAEQLRSLEISNNTQKN